MANKALAKRQKMTIRVEPSQKPGKARNQTVPSKRQTAAAPDGNTKALPPSLRERLLKRFS